MKMENIYTPRQGGPRTVAVIVLYKPQNQVMTAGVSNMWSVLWLTPVHTTAVNPESLPSQYTAHTQSCSWQEREADEERQCNINTDFLKKKKKEKHAATYNARVLWIAAKAYAYAVA